MKLTMADVGDTWKSRIGPGEIEDYNIVRYPATGKVYFQYLLKDCIDILVEDLKKNIADDYDNLVIIDGPEGSGKSTLAYQVCRAYNPNFDIETDYVYDVSTFWKKIKGQNTRHRCFWLDEGSVVANSRDWNTQDNKDFVQILETMRSEGWTIVMCIPKYDRLDVYLREFRSRYSIHCGPGTFEKGGYKDRGYFEVRKRTPYGTMTSACYGKFSPLPPELKTRYEEIKKDSQAKLKEKLGEDKSPGAKYKGMYEEKCKQVEAMMMLLHDSKALSDEEIMAIVGVENKKTFYNKLSKARARANGGGDDD